MKKTVKAPWSGACDDGGAALAGCAFVRGWFAHAALGAVAYAPKSEKRLKELESFWL